MEPVFVGSDGVPEPDQKYILHDIDEEEDEEGEETTRYVDTDFLASETCPMVPEKEKTLHPVQNVTNEGRDNLVEKSLEEEVGEER